MKFIEIATIDENEIVTIFIFTNTLPSSHDEMRGKYPQNKVSEVFQSQHHVAHLSSVISLIVITQHHHHHRTIHSSLFTLVLVTSYKIEHSQSLQSPLIGKQ